MIMGVDVSKWQREMDWYHCREAGARFAYVRAGSITDASGTCYTDDQFHRNAEIAPEYMPVGFYWFLRPYHDVLKQAEYFCNLIKPKRWLLPPVADIEAFGNLSSEAATIEIVKFIREDFRHLGIWPMIYTRAALWNSSTLADNLYSSLELWIARYTPKPSPWGNPGDKDYLKPRDWDRWRLWQFSADGNGRGGEFGAKSDSIDLNYFNGDENDFLLWTGQQPGELIKVNKPAAAIYSGPTPASGAGGAIMGTTWRGRSWQVLGKDGTGAWLRVEGWLKAKDCKGI